jgi:hypothetical protein
LAKEDIDGILLLERLARKSSRQVMVEIADRLCQVIPVESTVRPADRLFAYAAAGGKS